jgi:hypothetical protein
MFASSVSLWNMNRISAPAENWTSVIAVKKDHTARNVLRNFPILLSVFIVLGGLEFARRPY